MFRVKQEDVGAAILGYFIEMVEDLNSDSGHVRGNDKVSINVNDGTSLVSCQQWCLPS